MLNAKAFRNEDVLKYSPIQSNQILYSSVFEHYLKIVLMQVNVGSNTIIFHLRNLTWQLRLFFSFSFFFFLHWHV